MSRYHFSRSFKHHTGCSFKEYLNGKRIAAAKHLMVSKDRNVSESGLSVGFNRFSYFSRGFRKLEGRRRKSFEKP